MGRNITPAVLNTLGCLVADTWIFSASCVEYLGPFQLAENEVTTATRPKPVCSLIGATRCAALSSRKGKTEVQFVRSFAFLPLFHRQDAKLKWYLSGSVPNEILRLYARAPGKTVSKN